MGAISDAFNDAWRNYATDGVPASGHNEPDKADIRAAGAVIQAQFDSVVGAFAGTGAVYDTKAHLDADLVPAANVVARVVADSTPANNGYYKKVGATTTGSWSFLAAEPSKAFADAASASADDASDDADRAEAAIASLSGTPGDEFTEASGASKTPRVYQSVTFTDGLVYDFYVIAAPGARHRINLFTNGGAEVDATFDLEAGTATGTGATITARGNDEYLCAVSATCAGTESINFQIRVYPDSGGHPYTGDGTSGLFVQEAGISTGGGSNLLSHPTDFANAAWTKTHLTITTDARVFGNIYEAIASLASPADSLPLSGKKWAALGDSITIGGAYTGPVTELTAMTLTNLGVSGTTVAVNLAAVASIQAQVASIPSDTEIVTVAGGINDFALNTPLGSLGDTTTATFYGAYYAIVVAILAQAPNAQIVLISPYSGGSTSNGVGHNLLSTNSNSAKLWQFQKAVADSAKWLGVYLVDSGQCAGVGYFNATEMLYDGLHLNATGGQKVGDYIASELTRLAGAGLLV